MFQVSLFCAKVIFIYNHSKQSTCIGKIWLFDLCEALARMSGKRQCTKCEMAFLFCLSWVGKKLNLLSFQSVIFSIPYFVVKLIFPCQVCSPLSILRLVANGLAVCFCCRFRSTFLSSYTKVY